MKIRNGFVSNSSSSSFCIIGAKIKNKDEFAKKVKEKFALETDEDDGFWGINSALESQTEFCFVNEGTMFGIKIGQWSDYLLEINNMPMEELFEKFTQVRRLCVELGYPNLELSLTAGEECC